MLDCNVLPYFSALLKERNQSIRNNAIGLLVNFTAGSDLQTQAVIDAKLLPAIFMEIVIVNKGEKSHSNAKKLMIVCSNLICGAKEHRIEQLVEAGIIFKLCEMMKHYEQEIIIVSHRFIFQAKMCK